MEEAFWEKFRADRDTALLSLDELQIRAYTHKYGAWLPHDEKTFWAAVHKARIQLPDMPAYAKEFSRRWLRENGYGDGASILPPDSDGVRDNE